MYVCTHTIIRMESFNLDLLKYDHKLIGETGYRAAKVKPHVDGHVPYYIQI